MCGRPVGLVATPSSESVIVHASAVAEQHLLVADLARGQYADVSALIKSNKDQQAALKRDAETLVGMRGTSGQIMNMTKADSDYDLLYQLKVSTTAVVDDWLTRLCTDAYPSRLSGPAHKRGTLFARAGCLCAHC